MSNIRKLTPERQERVCAALAAGASQPLAAEYGGVAVRTFRNWRTRGDAARERQEAGEQITDEEQVYLAFTEAVAQAHMEAEMRNVASVEKAALGHTAEKTVHTVKTDGNGKITEDSTVTTTWHEFDWRAAAFWLQVHRPEVYAKRARMELTGADGGPVVFTTEEMEARALAAVDALTKKQDAVGS